MTHTDMTAHPLWSAQIELETEMRSMGIERFREFVRKAKEEGVESRTEAVRRLGCHVHEVVAQGIHDFIAEAKSGRAGRKHSALKYVEALGDVDLVAHITIRSIMDTVSTQETLNRAAIDLATLLEDELHFRQFKGAMPHAFNKFAKKAGKSSNVRYRRNAMLIPARKLGVELDEWSPREKVLLGTKLIEIFVERTGLAILARVSEGKFNTPIYVRATPATLEWIERENNTLEWMQPIYLPTIIPPKPWTTPFDGGYWSGRVRRLTLVKCHNNRQYLEELAGRSMPSVYSSINALQATPWAVNSKVISVMEELWANQSMSGMVPVADPEPLPTRPHWLTAEMTKETMTEAQLVEFKEWKGQCAVVHEQNAKAVGRRIAFARMLMVARRFAQEQEFFFPHQLDWRGRVYPVTLYLHPQGNDAQRGLLEFANACPINDEEGALWLAVHGAGCWGVDKLSLEDRRAWVVENEAAILASAADPFENRFWMGAEKPWQALAFCFDWAGFKAEGYAYESCLPVQMDGTCNGLQNFSAILRDEIGGRAVNLVPADKPQDIYTQVAEVVSRKVEVDALNHESDDVRELARQWTGNVTRKVTKRPVMTLAYGARMFGFKQQVMEDTIQPWRSKSPETFPFEGTGWAAADYMGRLIWESVGEVVVAASACMDWLQEAAKAAAREGLPVLWTTPTGFLVKQAYYLPNAKRIETTFETVRIVLSIEQDDQKIDSRRQASGVSPNWIHSLDASHMMRTIESCTQQGVRSFCMIHDSYGTHAGNAAVLAQTLRAEFVRMYEEDVLAKFRDDLLTQLAEGAELPPMPAKGSLDLSLVLESPFFFA